MPRRLLGVFMLLLVSVFIGRAQGDAVLLTVGDRTVSKSEFEYFFSRSSEKRADVFVETYARFKQKVQYARELGLDTLPEYRDGCEVVEEKWTSLRQLLAKDTLRTAREWIRLVHVSWPLKQSADNREQQTGKRYVDSVSVGLKANAPWPDCVEELPWIQTRHLLDEWQKQLDGLARNEFSKPFFSPKGVHVIAWTDKVWARTSPAERAKNADEAIRRTEREEGLLVAMLDNYWEKALACSEQELERHFLAHRADYGGGVPHFRGAVIHCQSKKEAKAIRKYLKNYPETLWTEAVERMPKEVSAGCRIEVGLFAIGKNSYVDKLVFKCGDFIPLPDFPYTWVLGKKLKKGPANYRDVRMEVEKDCLEAKKNRETEAFVQKYRVEIDKEVLKTVNLAENQ